MEKFHDLLLKESCLIIARVDLQGLIELYRRMKENTTLVMM